MSACIISRRVKRVLRRGAKCAAQAGVRRGTDRLRRTLPWVCAVCAVPVPVAVAVEVASGEWSVPTATAWSVILLIGAALLGGALSGAVWLTTAARSYLLAWVGACSRRDRAMLAEVLALEPWLMDRPDGVVLEWVAQEAAWRREWRRNWDAGELDRFCAEAYRSLAEGEAARASLLASQAAYVAIISDPYMRSRADGEYQRLLAELPEEGRASQEAWNAIIAKAKEEWRAAGGSKVRAVRPTTSLLENPDFLKGMAMIGGVLLLNKLVPPVKR